MKTRGQAVTNFPQEKPKAEIISSLLDSSLEDERANLDIVLDSPIIVIGDIGRWNGRVAGYKTIKSGNIKDCLCSDTDFVEWYVDEDGDLKCTASHHDGTNYYLYRKIKKNLSDEEMESLFDNILRSVPHSEFIDKFTERLGDEIGDVYGWTFK